MRLIPDISFQNRLLKRSRALATAVLLVGILVLTGWQFNIDILMRMVPGFVAMNPLTACCLILSAISLLLLNASKINSANLFIAYICAVIVLIAGVFKIADLIYDLDLKPDLLFFAGKIKATSIYGRPNYMAPNTALCLALSGITILLLRVETRTKLMPAQIIALLIAFMGLLSILGYIYQVKAFYEVPFFIPMALPTAISFFLLSSAFLLAQPAKGMMKDFTSVLTGSITARSLIPAAIIVPTLLGFFRLYGDWAGWYSKEFGVAVFALSVIMVFLALIWYNTILLNKRDLLKMEIEQALEKSRQEILYLGGLVEQSSDGIISFDPGFKLRTWNIGAEMIFGYKSDEVIGKNSREILKSESSAEQLDELRKNILSHGYWTGELTQYNKRNEPVSCLVSTSVLKNEAGETTGYLTIVKDISERKIKEDKLRKSEEELKKSNAEMEAFTYSVSHDLRAPLRSIVGFTTILEDDYTSKLDDEAKRLMGVIRRNTLRMGTLIDDLLEFSKLNKQDIIKTNIDTKAMVSEIIAELDGKPNNRHIDWDISELPATHADINSIRQVWINLISNAVKYSGKNDHPRISINAFSENGFVIFSVKDNGVGFEQKYSNKLFKVFQRLHGVSEFEGTGVGLAIVEKIISKHNGKVWAEAEPGKGATFYFSLPLNI